MPLTPHPAGYPIKLVRDKTASIVNPSGEPGELWYKETIDLEHYSRLLAQKLIEETGEYLISGEISELVDVLAVIDALAQLNQTNIDRLLKMMHADKRGLFRHGVIMYGKHPEYDR